MRLAAQARGGFYPAHEMAIALAASFLRPPAGGNFAILDPCAGEGKALRQFGELLGCPSITIVRHRAGRQLGPKRFMRPFPKSNVLAPADFFGCRASPNSFSFIWLNPPFDHGYGGHRVEEEFLWRATDWLMPNGVMALVCPEDVVDEYSDARQHFATYYENVSVVPFPNAHRPFREVIVFGHKRSRPVGNCGDSRNGRDWEAVLAPKGFCYEIPPGNGPRVFQKVEPTDSELQADAGHVPIASAPEVATRSPAAVSAIAARDRSRGPPSRQWAPEWIRAAGRQIAPRRSRHDAETLIRRRRDRLQSTTTAARPLERPSPNASSW